MTSKPAPPTKKNAGAAASACTRITGKNLIVKFTDVDISGDYRTFDFTEDFKTVDLSAGKDEATCYGRTATEGSASFSGLYATDRISDVWAATGKDSEGFLEWYPEGEVAGSPVYRVNAIAESRGQSYPYQDAIEIKIEFLFQADQIVLDVVTVP